jgi:NAD+ synthase (glutamine-hydrolysing)
MVSDMMGSEKAVMRLNPILVQFNPRVGDLVGNCRRILEQLGKRAPFSLAVLPELALCGYPPRDLLLRRGFVASCAQELQQMAQKTRDLGPVLIGAPAVADGAGTGLSNALWLLDGGDATVVHRKVLLPSYDVFDEGRYFTPGEELSVITLGGLRFGLTLCEDLWGGREVGQGRLYPADLLSPLSGRVDALINASASPYHRGKPAQRRSLAALAAESLEVPVHVVNQVGGNDELIFDGDSFSVTPDGAVSALPSFVEAVGAPCDDLSLLDGLAADHQALVLGLRDYVEKCGFERVVLGVSGGIDSALVALLAVQALGADNVHGLAMPSRFSSERSVVDAVELCTRLGIRLDVLPIAEGHRQISEMVGSVADAGGLTDENLQARLRGLLVMALSNATGALALTTGNKSELAVGYCTLYGDMNGGLAPIADLYKTDVFRLCAQLSPNDEGPIPQTIQTAPPSAELRPNQEDSDSLPPYSVLDAILAQLVDEQAVANGVQVTGADATLVKRIEGLVQRSEFKRWQAAPALRISKKSFGIGRRLPMAWRDGADNV